MSESGQGKKGGGVRGSGRRGGEGGGESPFFARSTEPPSRRTKPKQKSRKRKAEKTPLGARLIRDRGREGEGI